MGCRTSLIAGVGAVAVALIIAAIVWKATNGHVFLFPLVLLAGFPFFTLFRRGDPMERRGR